MRRVLAAVIAALALAAASCGGEESSAVDNVVQLTPTDVEGAWPLTVDSIALRCEPPGAVVATANSTDYAVNGLADAHEFEPIEPIWRPNPDIPGTRMDIGELIDAGLDLCE